jgi:hypothetical protein
MFTVNTPEIAESAIDRLALEKPKTEMPLLDALLKPEHRMASFHLVQTTVDDIVLFHDDHEIGKWTNDNRGADELIKEIHALADKFTEESRTRPIRIGYHKGEQCPRKPILCQEGFCRDCCIAKVDEGQRDFATLDQRADNRTKS